MTRSTVKGKTSTLFHLPLPTRHKVTEQDRYHTEGKKDMYNPERHVLEKVMVKWSKVELHKGQELEDNRKLILWNSKQIEKTEKDLKHSSGSTCCRSRPRIHLSKTRKLI